MPTKAQQKRMEEEWNNLSEEEQQKRLMIDDISMRGEPPVDTDGWSWEEYETTFKGKEVVVRVSIDIVRHWETVEVKEEITS